jgi:hypothetical protein
MLLRLRLSGQGTVDCPVCGEIPGSQIAGNKVLLAVSIVHLNVRLMTTTAD